MEVEQLAMPKKKAEEEYNLLKQAVKQNHKLQTEQITKDYLKVLGHLQHGKKIIDVYEAFKKVGLNADGDPKLAIVRADSKNVLCEKYKDGSAKFYHDNAQARPRFDSWKFRKNIKGDVDDIRIPSSTFTFEKDQYGRPKHESLTTIAPIIPAKILVNEVKVLLKNFHLLWEVNEWKPIPPKDPILLKRLTPNLFGVLATWDLTEIERAIIRGRIQI